MIRRLGRDRSGAAAVEFALVLPVLLLLLGGILEFSRLMWTQANLQFAAEEGARYGIAHTEAAADAISAVSRARLSGVETAKVQIMVEVNAAQVTVTANHNFQFVMDGILPFGPLPLTATSRFPRS
jgi:Flp pilus assembly protein TadG